MCKESSCICAKLPVNTRPHPMVKRASPVRAIGTCACPLEPDIRNRRVKRYLLEEVGDVGDCVSTNFQPQKSVDSYQNNKPSSFSSGHARTQCLSHVAETEVSLVWDYRAQIIKAQPQTPQSTSSPSATCMQALQNVTEHGLRHPLV